MSYSFDSKEHLHSLDGKPLKGASTIVGVLSKPLSFWASGKACEVFGWTNSKLTVEGKYVTIPLEKRIEHVKPYLAKIKEMDEPQFLALADQAYKAHASSLKDSAQKGTDMHAELEKYVKECIVHGGAPMAVTVEHEAVNIFSRWAVENVEKFIYSEVHGFSKELWVGGISDVGAMLKDGKRAIVDFKSSKDAYVSQFLQLAVYDILLSENGLLTSDGKKIADWSPADAYIVFPFGMAKPEPKIRYEVDAYRKGARYVSYLYDMVNNTNFTN